MFKNIQIFQKINIFQILKKKYPHFEETLVFIQLGSRWWCGYGRIGGRVWYHSKRLGERILLHPILRRFHT